MCENEMEQDPMRLAYHGLSLTLVCEKTLTKV